MAYTDIDDPSAYFQTTLYTGNSTEPRNIDVGFQTDFTWVKDRTIAYHHRLFDSTRGGAPIYSNQTSAQDGYNDGPELDFSSPHTNGFKIVDNPDGTTNSYGVNQNNSNIISWNWKCNGGTTSTNTSGSINSTVQVNSDAGFSIVKFTGDNSSDQTIGHGLGTTPHMIILKAYTVTAEWVVFHKKMGNGRFMYLNNANGQSNDISYWGTPSTTTFGVKGGGWANNVSGADHIAYCFAPKQGYSKFGNYKGNGSANGAFVYTGFKPAFVMTKSTSTGSWSLYDNKRLGYNPIDVWLRANGPDAESTSAISGDDIDLYSNGFKLRNSDNTINGSGTTYIYMAFAENPLVTSTGAPTTAR